MTTLKLEFPCSKICTDISENILVVLGGYSHYVTFHCLPISYPFRTLIYFSSFYGFFFPPLAYLVLTPFLSFKIKEFPHLRFSVILYVTYMDLLLCSLPSSFLIPFICSSNCHSYHLSIAAESQYISPVIEMAEDNFGVHRNLATAGHFSDRQTGFRLWTEFTRFWISTHGCRGIESNGNLHDSCTLSDDHHCILQCFVLHGASVAKYPKFRTAAISVLRRRGNQKARRWWRDFQ
jgi:hypothetical protein